MGDLVRKQSVIDAVMKYCMAYDLRELLADIDSLPSAQPEIVRCKDCKKRYIDCPMHHVEWVEYDDGGYINVDDIVYDYTTDNDFCSKAERREDDER